MFISKFWTLLLALIIGVSLAVILLGRDVVNRERAENTTAILFKEMSKVDVALKLHARKRLDVLLSIAVDPEIRSMLYSASADPGKVVKIRDKLRGVLRKRNGELDKYKADMLMITDLSGDVICQVGKNERQHSYNLAGFPAVDAALRGYLRDDIWKIANEVFLIAARPIIEQGRYVGALIHGMELTDKLAGDMSPTMQLAFFAGNTMIAVGAPEDAEIKKAQGSHIAKPLDDVIQNENFKKQGYSDAQKIETSDVTFMAVYSRVRGEASENDVGFALVVPVIPMTSPAEFYEKAGTQDIEALPIVKLVLGIILIAALGWLWNYLEGQRPLTKLLVNIKALEKSDPKDQLNIYRFRRRIRKVATAINELIDYKIRSLLDSSEGSRKSINMILKNREEGRLSSASFKFVEPTSDEVPLPPPSAGLKEPSSKKKLIYPAQPVGKGSPPVSDAPKPPKPPTPPAGVPPIPKTAADEGLAQLSPEEEDRYFHEIYDEFIKLKKQLGEATEQLTFERFLVTLKKNRDTLMARYDCKRVKFQVYEKDRKASLKATPIKG
jgi:hypothetical protein